APETVPETLPAARRRLRRALSFEVIPPRSATQAERMPQLLRFLDSLSPDYLAVTSSAKSDWLRGTADFIAEVTSTTTLRPLAHLACTAGTESELLAWIDHLLQVGVRGFLAIRGDFPDGETSVPPDHLPHADALVSLLRRVEADNVACLAAGRPGEGLDVLAAIQRNGAAFAVTQLSFHPTADSRMRRRAAHAGIAIPIIPGILPIADARRLDTQARLSWLPVPAHLLARFDGVS